MARYTEKRLLKIHDAYGRAKFGNKRWERANFGWAQGYRDIASKVYALTTKQRTQILSTEWKRGETQPHHLIEDY